ncbi:MAG: hypothetical protein M3347_04605 [Armatimonadota bacterium]|nr:hypothetical protein [Armatimonadota bacterium]
MNRTEMQSKAWRATLVALPIGALIAATTAPVWAGPKLVMNGKTASTDVRVIKGKVFIPAADVAKALGMVVVKRGDDYEIKKAGGANPIKGVLQGKVGDVLFDGKWRFQVLKVETPDTFTMKSNSVPDYNAYKSIAEFDIPTRLFRPQTGYKLVVLSCRVTNAVNQQRALWVFQPETHNALADMSGTSHPPIAHDFEGAPHQSKPLLPGAKLDFALVFSVPTDTRLKDLVFTLRTISEPGNDVRVSLTP